MSLFLSLCLSFEAFYLRPVFDKGWLDPPWDWLAENAVWRGLNETSSSVDMTALIPLLFLSTFSFVLSISSMTKISWLLRFDWLWQSYSSLWTGLEPKWCSILSPTMTWKSLEETVKFMIGLLAAFSLLTTSSAPFTFFLCSVFAALLTFTEKLFRVCCCYARIAGDCR